MSNIDQDLKPLPNRSDHNCFGCGPSNPVGLQMQFFTDDTSVVSEVTIPEHLCGWDNLVHGGAITTILDEIMSWAAIYLLKRMILTKSITVEFLKPLHVNTTVKAEGRVRDHRSEKEAVMEGLLLNPKGDICARSEGRFALLDKKKAQRLGLMSTDALDAFSALKL